MNFNSLPVELLLEVGNYLDIPSLCTLVRVNKNFGSVYNTADVWKFAETTILQSHKSAQTKSARKMSVKSRVRQLSQGFKFCVICAQKITRLTQTSRQVQHLYGKRWCYRCCKANLLPKSKAVIVLRGSRFKGRPKEAQVFLATCTSFESRMNGSPATYYLASQIRQHT